MPASVKTSRGTPPRSRTWRPRIVVLVLAALAVAGFGVTGLVDTWTAPPTVVHEGNLDGMHARIAEASWVNLADMAKGMASGMPMNKMANMPKDGDGRVEVKVNVTNPTDQTRLFLAAEEFALRAERGGKRWIPSSDTFGDLPRLAPRNAVNGILYFDMPPADLKDTMVWLEWTREGGTAALNVPLSGSGDGMDHSNDK